MMSWSVNWLLVAVLERTCPQSCESWKQMGSTMIMMNFSFVFLGQVVTSIHSIYLSSRDLVMSAVVTYFESKQAR